jgi:methyltransferase (TIGR00027 family)
MKAGAASETARRVAAHRLTFDRAPAPYGDPAADETLARDVAGSVDLAGSTDSMVGYLAARTTFFDRVVVGTLERGVEQMVIAGAGYDGRALRYAKPGVRWFELDHPDTQLDKLERLARLGIDVDHVTFASADFAVDDVGAALGAAGHDPNASSLFVCEGVAIYLEYSVLESLMRQLRGVAADGSRLAISLSVTANTAAETVRRTAFRAAVAAMGEPARTVLTAEEVDALLLATGWTVTPSQSERARHAGLLVLEPT